MSVKKVKKILLLLLLALSVDSNHCQWTVPIESKLQIYNLDEANIRYARLRCLQQFPQAETVSYSDTTDTHCFLHCFVYKTGLMDLTTRGLDSDKFFDIWQNIEEAFSEGSCVERFDFSEPLSGTCGDTYRKLMEFRSNCLELFEYTFTVNSTWKSEEFQQSKQIGQSATEFCDLNEAEDVLPKENSQDEDVSLVSQYKDKLICIFENIHYLDAYGRVDVNEINLSFQEAHEESAESQAAVRNCAHRANSKYQDDYLGSTALELQVCLKTLSAAFMKVFKFRDEISRQY